MSELQTNNLDQLVLEIKFYSQQTALNMIEVGKRLIEAKGKVPRGVWGKWLNDNVDYTPRRAQQFMKVAEEFGKTQSISYLDHTKLLALLDIPPNDRESFTQTPHELPSGETKTVNEMTTRELQAAIKAQKEAEHRACEAERINSELNAHAKSIKAEADKKIKLLTDKLIENSQSVKTLQDIEEDNQTLRQANKILENKIKTAGDPIIIETPVQVFPPDYERIKKENAELKAHKQGITLQQLSEVNEHCKQYAKTLDEEERFSKIVNKVLDVLLGLPDGVEINELARCYLKCSPADTTDEITVVCSIIDNGIQRLSGLKKAIQDSTKLRVVKNSNGAKS